MQTEVEVEVGAGIVWEETGECAVGAGAVVGAGMVRTKKGVLCTLYITHTLCTTHTLHVGTPCCDGIASLGRTGFRHTESSYTPVPPTHSFTSTRSPTRTIPSPPTIALHPKHGLTWPGAPNSFRRNLSRTLYGTAASRTPVAGSTFGSCNVESHHA